MQLISGYILIFLYLSIVHIMCSVDVIQNSL